MEDKFKPGDIVQLKSGGPAMTVSVRTGASLSYNYQCEWFKGATKERAPFQEEVLQFYEPPKTK